jgi:probable rRNA maturation factor
MTFCVEVETDKEIGLDYQELFDKIATKVLDDEQCPYEVEINLLITDDISIQKMNREYRNIDRPTDVLSFPMIEYKTPSDFSEVEGAFSDCFNPETGELLLGDIVVSIDKVMEQAENYGHSREREISFLIAHSMLHLLGYDHMEEEDTSIMEKKQKKMLEELGINR